MAGCRMLNSANVVHNIRKVAQHSAQCRGICNLMQKIRLEGLASTLLAECSTYKGTLNLESSAKVRENWSKKTRYAINVEQCWAKWQRLGGMPG